MGIINHHHTAPVPRASRNHMRLFLRVAGIVAVVFLLANIGMGIAYHGRVLPNYSMGTKQIGGISFDALATLKQAQVINPNIVLTANGTKQNQTLSDMGVGVDLSATTRDVRQTKTWIPVLSLVMHHSVPLVIRTDAAKFATAVRTLAPSFEKPALDKHIGFNGSAFAVAAPQDGSVINVPNLKQSITHAVVDGTSDIAMPMSTTKPTVHDIDLSADVAKFNKQLDADVSYDVYGQQKVVPTKTDKAAWFVSSGQSLMLSDDAIKTYLAATAIHFNTKLANQTDLITATKYALAKALPYDFRMISTSGHMRTYCTATRGVSDASAVDLAGKLAATYADVRGWNDGGLVGFEHVQTGCEYTVWLAASSQMSSFGEICDDYYNCQIGANVVVNDDRWEHATDVWNQTGRSLEEYRVLIIDHETGHRLGFRDNPTCPGPGQLAPVMMQQSIDLKGCTFNVWPTAAELQALKSML